MVLSFFVVVVVVAANEESVDVFCDSKGAVFEIVALVRGLGRNFCVGARRLSRVVFRS